MNREDASAIMLNTYLEDIAYYRLDGPIPDNWNPPAIEGEAFKAAKRRCEKFVDAAFKNGVATHWNEEQWATAADVLCASDSGQGGREFIDDFDEHGFTENSAMRADDFMKEFLKTSPISENDSMLFWPDDAQAQPENGKNPGASCKRRNQKAFSPK